MTDREKELLESLASLEHIVRERDLVNDYEARSRARLLAHKIINEICAFSPR
jgi:hypothetical protein